MTQRIKWFSITLLLLVVSMVLLLFLWPMPPLLKGISYSRAVFASHKELLRLTLSADGQYRLPVPVNDISPQLKQATLLQEDQYFYWHAGINPISMIKAGWHTYIRGPRRMGASTITMQVARMRFHINSKTLLGKTQQVLRALQLELHYSKDEILEAYLTLAPYGNNIEGIGAASFIYFGKPTKELSLPEILTLVVIPQNPNKRLPDHAALKIVRDKFFERWIRAHPADKNQTALMALPLQMRNVRAAPFLAPHFVNKVLNNSAIKSTEIVTTLDLHLQKLIERVTLQYLARKKNYNVNNAAVLIIDTRDMGVKALLGSANFFNQSIGGQVNGVDARRSPGSTLKPFIYALALDQGLIHPATVLKDVPKSFGSYNPENFDYDFAGPIKAKDALTLSRNIPAVYLADQLKHPNLYEFLQQVGIGDLKSENYYGLALVLGGAEVTMTELASMYAMLANDGVWKSLRYSQNEVSTAGQHFVSPEASFLVLDMLQDNQYAGVNYGITKKNRTSISWKTGTSSGYRDAWTAGVFGPYVMIVWVGNFNNESNHAFIGKEIAAPLFFDIVNAMATQKIAIPERHKYPERMHLVKIDVCKASGLLPTRYCTDTESVWFIPGKSPIKTDTIYREIAINKKTGLRTCKFDRQTHFEVYEFWSSDLLKIFQRAGIQRRIPPAPDASCMLHAHEDQAFAPQITSPQVQANYITQLAQKNATLIPFAAVVDADVRHLHWFLNETYLGQTKREQPFLWKAQAGKYVLRVVDDYGRSDARDLNVQIVN